MRGLDAVLDELRAALRSNIAALAENLLGPPNAGLSGRSELRWGNRGSFRVTVNGHARGACVDYESDWRGDPIGLIQRERGCDFVDAVLWGAGWAGIDTEGHQQAKPEDLTAKHAREAARARKRVQDETAAEADRKRRIGVARDLWQRRADAIDTVAEQYVVLTRGIPIRPMAWPDAVGFLPSNEPDGAGALILAATLADGTIVATQQVFLTENAENIWRDGRKLKITRGFKLGAAVRLPGPADGPLLFAEGPETGLSAWVATGFETHITLGSLSSMIPPSGRPVVICRDDDKPNSQADKTLGRLIPEWRNRGVNVVVATPWRSRRGDKTDFNDVIKAGGAEAVRERIAIALDPGASPPKRLPVAEARRTLDEAVGRFFPAITEWQASVTQAENDAKLKADTLIWDRLPDAAKAHTLARAEAKITGAAARAAREAARKSPPGDARAAAQAKYRLAEAAAKKARQRASDATDEARPLQREIDRIKRQARKTIADATRAVIAAAPVHAIRVDTGIGKSQAARRAVALHLKSMRAAGDARTVAFAVPTHALGAEQVTLLAVVPAQIVSLGLQTAPAKPTDKRSFTGETVQCEAIPPDTLAAIVRDAIESRLDRDAYDLVLAREKVMRAVLTEQLRPLLDEAGAP